jgi:hypothetical protein
MNKDEVLKQRGEVFESALRLERARNRVAALTREIESARGDYNAAVLDLSQKRSNADATEASAVLELTKGEREVIEVSASGEVGIKLLP